MAIKRNPAPVAVIAALDERLNQLRARRRSITDEIIDLESKGAVATPSDKENAPQRHVDALALLAGDETAPAPVAPSANVRVYRLFREREVIDEALRLGEQQVFRARVDARAEIAKDIEEAWMQNVRATCTLHQQLIALAGERERLVGEFCVRTGLQADLLVCLGHARAAAPGRIVDSPAYRLFAEAKRTKIID